MLRYRNIVVTNEKGGVGKTTLSTHLAALCAVSGLRVLFIDAAPQGNASMSLGLRPRPNFYDWLVREDSLPEDVITVYEDVDRIAFPDQPLKGSLHVIRGNKETVGVAQHVSSYALRAAIEEIEDEYDVVIIDTDPSVSAMAAMLYSAADAMIIPSKMAFLDLNAVINTIADAPRQAQRDVPVLGIVPTFYATRVAVHGQNHAGLLKYAKQQGWDVWHPIRQLTGFEMASNHQRMVYTLDDPSARSATDDLLKMFQQFTAKVRTHVG